VHDGSGSSRVHEDGVHGSVPEFPLIFRNPEDRGFSCFGQPKSVPEKVPDGCGTRPNPLPYWAMIPTVVLLAAGMSTRYGRLKQLEPVGPGGEALIDYAAFDARRAGFSRILLIIREELEEVFQAHITGWWPGDLEVVFHHQRIDDLPGVDTGPTGPVGLATVLDKREKPWGTAHALLTARAQLPGSFVVLNADDFYGASAFLQAAEFLQVAELLQATELSPAAEVLAGETLSGADEAPTFGLVTYTLGDTLSEHGGVSRGICEIDAQGWLEGIREVLEIRRRDEDIFGRTVSGQNLVLKGTEPISTNFWLFTPALFPILEAGFVDFFRAQFDISSDQLEFLIPTVVNGALRTGAARVRGIPTAGRFLGITHPDDREWVVRGLEEMTEEGRYPSPLWA